MTISIDLRQHNLIIKRNETISKPRSIWSVNITNLTRRGDKQRGCLWCWGEGRDLWCTHGRGRVENLTRQEETSDKTFCSYKRTRRKKKKQRVLSRVILSSIGPTYPLRTWSHGRRCRFCRVLLSAARGSPRA